jgi:hypothetical protein
VSDESTNTAPADSSEQKESTTQEKQQGNSSSLNIENIIKWIDKNHRFPAAILLGVLAILAPIAWKIPASEAPRIWTITIALVLLILVIYLFLASTTRKELTKLKNKEREWIAEKNDLNLRISSLLDQHDILAGSNNSNLTVLKQRFGLIRASINSPTIQSGLMDELIRIADMIDGQIDENTSESRRIKGGIATYKNADEISDGVVASMPNDSRSKKIY